jgi:hypothetical protein
VIVPAETKLNEVRAASAGPPFPAADSSRALR